MDGRVVSRAVVIATGVTADGGREVLGLDVGDSEDGAFWTAFLRSLKARGLTGVQLVISDAHTGLKPGHQRGHGRCRLAALPGPLKLEGNNVSFSVFGLDGVVCAACAYRWRSVVNSPPGSRCCCRI